MATPLRVLNVEDTEADSELMLHAIRRGGFDPVARRVETAAGLRAALDADSWDVVVCDYRLPGFSAGAALDIVRASGHDLPFIVVSGVIDMEHAVSMFRAGAHDFVNKNDPARLAPAIERELREVEVRRRQRQAEEAARASEAKFRDLIEGSIQGILILTPKWKPLFANQAAADIFGYDSPDELLALAATTPLVAEDELNRIRGYNEARLEGRPAPDQFTFKCVRKDGSLIWLQNAARLVEWEGENAIQATMVDVTEAKRAELALRASEAKYRNLVETMNDGLTVVDENGVYTYVNDKFCDMLGSGRSELVGRPSFETLTDASAAFSKQQFGQRPKGGRAPYEIEFRRKDGREVPVILSPAPIMDADGTFKGSFAVVTDITERKQAEAALRASEAKYRDLIEGSIQGIFINTRDWKPLFANRAAAEIFGYESPEEMLALESNGSLIAEVDRDRVWQRKEARYQGREVVAQYEFQGVRKDGSLIWVQNLSRLVEWEGELAIQISVIDVTEARRAEEALRESEERYRKLVELAPDAIVVNDRTHLVFANEAAARMHGADSPDEIVGRHWLDLIHKDEHEKARRRNATMARNQTSGEIVIRRRLRLDGSEFPVETTAAPIVWQGRPAIMGIIRDLTEQHETQVRLQRSEQSLANAQRIANVGSWTWNLEEDEIVWSDENHRIFGVRPEEFSATYDAFLNLVHPEDMAVVDRALNTALANRTSHRIEYRLVRPDGEERIVEDTAEPELDEAGRPVRMVGTVRDITEAKRGEDELRASEERYRTLVELSPEAIIVHDGTHLVFANAAAAKSHGAGSPEDLVGMRWLDLVHPDEREFASDRDTRFLDGELPARSIARRRLRLDGSEFPVEIAVARVTWRDQPAILAMFRDLTDQRRAEAHLRQLQDELFHVSRLSAMGELSSAMAHELNQPLTAIMNYVQACRRLVEANKTGVSDQISGLIAKAVEQTERAGAIIRGLRRFVTSGETERSWEDINRAISEAEALGLIGTVASGVSIRENLSDALPPVLIDKVQIQQVILNLVRNALEAMADSETRELTITTSANGGGEVTVDFRDTGPGLAEGVADRLFEPFITTKQDGMGIGLSISHSIIESHGGRLSARPAPGTGTIFSFTLPAAPADSVAHDA